MVSTQNTRVLDLEYCACVWRRAYKRGGVTSSLVMWQEWGMYCTARLLMFCFSTSGSSGHCVRVWWWVGGGGEWLIRRTRDQKNTQTADEEHNTNPDLRPRPWTLIDNVVLFVRFGEVISSFLDETWSKIHRSNCLRSSTYEKTLLVTERFYRSKIKGVVLISVLFSSRSL